MDKTISEKENKQFSTVLKTFTLHGKTFHEGELISYKEHSYLIDNLKSAKLISNTHLETT